MITTEHTLHVAGPYDLARTAGFAFGPTAAEPFDGCLRLAFCLDGYRSTAGVVVRRGQPGRLDLSVTAADEPAADRAATQVARILSVDVDAEPFVALAAADPVLAPLVAAAPGLRPPLFASAYEALAWAVLSARRPRQQMAELRDRLARAHGWTFRLAGRELAAFPPPAALLEVSEFPGLPPFKLRRLHAVAEAALDGRLDTAALRDLEPAEAMVRARELDGIGPFYAELMAVRALGHTDVLPVAEPLVRSCLAALLGQAEPISVAEFTGRAEAWRPWRTWASVFLRAVGPRVLAERAGRDVAGVQVTRSDGGLVGRPSG